MFTVVISGTIGAGKTTVAEELSDLLDENDIIHGLIDLDWLGQMYPRTVDDPFNRSLTYANLADVARRMREHGASHLVIAGVVEDSDDVACISNAINSEHVTVLRVRAPESVRMERIRNRELGSRCEWHLNRTVELDAILDSAQLESISVVNHDRPLRETALEAAVKLGWLDDDSEAPE